MIENSSSFIQYFNSACSASHIAVELRLKLLPREISALLFLCFFIPPLP